MTYYFDNLAASSNGVQPGREHWNWAPYRGGDYITPDGALLDIDRRAQNLHGGGFILPFFLNYANPSEEIMRYYSKKDMLENLYEWKNSLINEEFYNCLQKEKVMKLQLVKYLINVYESERTIYDRKNKYFDMSYVTGLPNPGEKCMWERNRLLKDILVQACNYDALESQVYRGITTSKFNIYETFYDYLLHDYRIFQIPKKIFDEQEGRYVDYSMPEVMIPDSELRLKEEIEAIRKSVPLEKRRVYCRCKEEDEPIEFYY